MNQQKQTEIARRVGLKGDEPWMADFVGLVLEAAAETADKLQGEYSESEGNKWPELRADAETGAGACASTIRDMKPAQSPAPIPEQVAQATSGIPTRPRIEELWGRLTKRDISPAVFAFAYDVANDVLATQSAKQGAQPLMSQRQSFEHWFSDEGKHPRAVERSGDGYVLLSAQSAWEAWKAAYKALDVTGRPSGSPSPVIQASVEQAPVAQEVTQQAAKAETAEHADIPEGTARGSDGTTYHGIAEIYYRFEEGESLHAVLDDKQVSRADAAGKVYSLVGRVALLTEDGSRFRWLNKDHADVETRRKARELARRLGTSSYFAISRDIDYAMGADSAREGGSTSAESSDLDPTTSTVSASGALAAADDVRLTPLNEDTGDIFGRPNFTCTRIAQRLRDLGRDIKNRAANEQAAVIHFLLNMYEQHGADWRAHAEEYLRTPTAAQAATDKSED